MWQSLTELRGKPSPAPPFGEVGREAGLFHPFQLALVPEAIANLPLGNPPRSEEPLLALVETEHVKYAHRD